MPQKEIYRSELIVELHVPDFQRAYDFYKLLGFELAWMEEDYMVLKSGAQAICFYGGSSSVANHSYFGKFPEHTKKGYGVELVVFVDDIQGLYKSIEEKITVVRELTTRPWGAADFRVEDPFGFYIRVSQRYEMVNRDDKIEQTSKIVDNKKFVL